MGILLTALGLAAGIVLYAALSRAPRRPPEIQAELERAVAAIDRELAANLELTTMFDQTRQAFVLENGQFAANRQTIARDLALSTRLETLYARLPEAEAAMERRGPAGSIADADRLVVEDWEGEARDLQRALRAAVAEAPRPRWRALLERFGRA